VIIGTQTRVKREPTSWPRQQPCTISPKKGFDFWECTSLTAHNHKHSLVAILTQATAWLGADKLKPPIMLDLEHHEKCHGSFMWHGFALVGSHDLSNTTRGSPWQSALLCQAGAEGGVTG